METASVIPTGSAGLAVKLLAADDRFAETLSVIPTGSACERTAETTRVAESVMPTGSAGLEVKDDPPPAPASRKTRVVP
jgi:hypothetical protein